MAIYTVGRGRVILALVLTSMLLITLDARGNPVIDRVRDGFSRVLTPVEQAAEVITLPAQRAWNAYDNYDDLERENEILQARVDRQTAAEAAAIAAIIDSNFVLALSNLPSLAGIPTAKAQVVGSASNNVDQVVEINKGSNDGIAVGMMVVNDAGLIGKITQVNTSTSRIMLVTDPRFEISVEVLAGVGAIADEDLVPIGEEEIVPVGTSALDVLGTTPELPQFDDLVPPTSASGDSVPGDTTPDSIDPESSVPVNSDPGDTTPEEIDPADPALDDPVAPTAIPPTTTSPPTATDRVEKEFGSLVGRGQGRPLQVQRLQDVPSLATFEIGDLVETAGNSESLAPPNIPIGRVINVVERDGVSGPLLEIALNADLSGLNIVQVVLFQPLTELPEQ